jgi:hypothetical protein
MHSTARVGFAPAALLSLVVARAIAQRGGGAPVPFFFGAYALPYGYPTSTHIHIMRETPTHRRLTNSGPFTGITRAPACGWALHMLLIRLRRSANVNQRSEVDPTVRRPMTIPRSGQLPRRQLQCRGSGAEGFPAGRDCSAWLGPWFPLCWC